MADILGLMNHISQRTEAGMQQGKDNHLARLYQQALSGPRDQRQSVIAQMAGVNPQAAFDANKHFESFDDNGRQRLGQYASAFDALPDDMKAQAYPQLAKQAQELGIPAPTEWNPAYAPHIQKLAQSLGGGAAGGRVQSRFVGEDGQIYALMSDSTVKPLGIKADPNTQIVEGQGGFYGVDKRTLGATPVQIGQPSAQPGPVTSPQQQAADPNQVFASLHQSVPGLRVTSGLRTPEENARLPNSVPNSYHLTGQAIDIDTPTPQQRQQVNAWAARNGYEVVDNYKDGHVHIEPRGGGTGGSATPQQPSRQLAPTGPAPSPGYQWNADRTAMIPIPGGPADKPAPTPGDFAKDEMSMRKELDDRLKDPRTIINAYRGLELAGKDPSAASDMSIIFAYMKMLDPASTVREGEYASAQNTTGIPGQIINFYNKAKSGNFLTPQQREDFIRQARQRADLAQQQITSTTREYQDIAEQYGYDVTRSTGMPDFRNVTSGGPSPQQQDRRGGDVGDLLTKYGVQ